VCVSAAAAAAVVDTPINRQMNECSMKKLCNVATMAIGMQIATCARSAGVVDDPGSVGPYAICNTNIA